MFNYFEDLYINHMFGYEYIITNVLLSLFISLSMNTLPFKGWKNILFKVLDWLVTWLISLVVADIYYWAFGLDYMQYVMWTIPVLIHLFSFRSKPIADRITKAVTILTMIFASLIVSEGIGEAITFDDEWVMGITTIIILASMIICAFWMSFFTTKEYNVINEKILIVVLINFIISTTISIISNLETLDKWYKVVTNLFFMVNAITIYYVYFAVTKEQAEKTEYIAVNIKKTNDKTLLKASINNLGDLHKIRHDLKNQYQYMKTLLDEKKYDELNTFFADMSESSFVPLSYIDCGNTPISIAMNQAQGRANRHDIKFISSIIVPKQMEISDLDLSRLLGNILDNAIDSVVNEKLESPEISIKIIHSDPYLVISVSNPISEEKASRLDVKHLQTTKKNKSIHGYGTKIITDICKKNNGSVSFSISDGRFIVDAMVKAKEIK